MLAREIDVVRLRDGRVGTIVHEYSKSSIPEDGPEAAYEIEFGDGEYETIEPDDIVEIVHKYSKE